MNKPDIQQGKQHIAITGHTSGIGKCLYNRLCPSAIGFSLSNGYDITIAFDRQRIIREANNCDVFINNAHAGFGQTLLFLELFQAWRNNTNKTIINVGSRITEIKQLPDNRQDLLQYQAEKLILKEMSSRVTGECTIKYKWFGYVGTKKILTKYSHFTESDYITEEQAADIILSQ
jgi:short-subunit dehydrogenase